MCNLPKCSVNRKLEARFVYPSSMVLSIPKDPFLGTYTLSSVGRTLYSLPAPPADLK